MRSRACRRSGRRTPSPHWALIASASASLFVAMGLAARVGATRGVNHRVRKRMNPRANKRATQVAKAISRLGTPEGHLLLAVCMAVCIRALRGHGGKSVIAASLGASTLDKLSRTVIRQQRPPLAGTHHGLDRFAYPSGHVCAITAITTATVGELSSITSEETDMILRATATLVSMVMGWSRLYLDEHWIDDVIGGFFAGIAVGTAAVEIR